MINDERICAATLNDPDQVGYSFKLQQLHTVLIANLGWLQKPRGAGEEGLIYAFLNERVPAKQWSHRCHVSLLVVATRSILDPHRDVPRHPWLRAKHPRC